MNLVSTILVALLAIIATPQRPEPDVKESSDYPMFANRMPGYRISSYKKQVFSSHRFDTNPPQTIEGRYIYISYHLDDSSEPPGNLAIRRNYQNAAKSAGIQIIPSRFPDSHVIFKASRNGVEVWVDLYTINPQDYTMTIIERTAMQQVIRANEIAAALDKDGFIALDIHFATGKAEILPESRPIVDEIVSLLKNRPNLRIGVEGHTDNTGTPVFNKTLSNARAKAVAEAIAAAGINPNRLEPGGYGQERPVADNGTEEGRAKNRRVELVKR